MTTVTQACELYRSWMHGQVKIGRMRPRTVEYYTRYHTLWENDFGKKSLKKIIALDLMLWGCSWHRVQSVQRLFNWSVKAGLIESSPVASVEKPAKGQRNRVLSRLEAVKSLRMTFRAFRTFLLALRESMARPQEIRELRWPDLRQLPSGEWYAELDDFKGRRRRRNPFAKRIIPFSPRMCRLIERLRRKKKTVTGFVFHNSRGLPWTANAVRCAMADLRKLVGLDDQGGGEKVVCYTWRHSAITAATVRGLRDRILAELGGHASTRTTARYQHLAPDDLIHAYTRSFERIPAKKRSVSTLRQSALYSTSIVSF